MSGPLMLDCAAIELSEEEREKLAHPLVGGVILFSRNYSEPDQLRALIHDIRTSAKQPLIIAVDHEGGRVQRFRNGFTSLPAMGKIGRCENNAELAFACGAVMAYELKAFDIDLSFAPVLDLCGVSDVIGDRAFGDNPQDVIRLAFACIDGMHAFNMPATGKHFPGHGSVKADSHVAIPVDPRSFEEIEKLDLTVFSALIKNAKLDAIMPAHVIYPAVDDQPAGFSQVWLQTLLKQTLGFDGVIFSDDLSMHGASVAGGYPERARAALAAGCTMVLACNNPKGAEEILDSLSPEQFTSEHITRLSQRCRNVIDPSLYTRSVAALKNAQLIV